MRLWPVLCKLIQKQTYTCLSTSYGVWVAFVGLCTIFVAVLRFGEVALEWSMRRSAGNFRFGRYYDNIAGRSFEPRLCLPHPIDIVYTWVNGSDLQLIAELNTYKLTVEAELNKTLARDKLIDTARFKWVNKTHCPLPNCVQANKIATASLPTGTSLTKLIAADSQFQKAQSVEFWDDVAIISFASRDDITQSINKIINYEKTELNITDVFYTSTIKKGQKTMGKVVILTNVRANETQQSLRQDIYENLNIEDGIESIVLSNEQELALVQFKNEGLSNRLKEIGRGNYFKGHSVLSTTLVWKPFTDQPKFNKHALSANRFADNDELKYSLRSVEKFAPWVRKIFIVTNGQIPSWLNLEHRRIELITHEQIFSNKSHLPTFSSPAIEANIHRIPGLSKKFIYMNDDVFFGQEVWPDDFYTHAKGQKIFQAWAVPNCHEGCPSSWLNDKYCDKACNYTECDFDGGDCLASNKNTRQNSLIQSRYGSNRNNLVGEYCSPGCAHNWLGDRYCDGNCNTKDCGFDAGDCGTDGFGQLFSHSFTSFKWKNIVTPPGTLAMFVNISSLFDSIVDAQYESEKVLRSAIMGKKSKELALTFFKNHTNAVVAFKILGYRSANETDKQVFSFNVTVYSHVAEVVKKKEIKEKHMESVSYPPTVYKGPLFPVVTKSPTKHKVPHVQGDVNKGNIESNSTNGNTTKRQNKDSQRIDRKLLWTQATSKEIPITVFTTDYSFLPWERLNVFPDLKKLQGKVQLLLRYKTRAPHGRHLLDTFASSLLHVSRVFNKAFGYNTRKIPAHMPHFVDRDVVVEMQERFADHFALTSSHKMRHPKDMQFAFSYNYYLVEKDQRSNVSLLFDMVDTDRSGALSDRELRSLAAIIYEIPISLPKIQQLEMQLKNCSQRLQGQQAPVTREKYHDKDLPLVTKLLFLNCHELWRSVNFTGDRKYKYELTNVDDVIFKMLHNNISQVLYQLDYVRKHRKKFVCLNDDLDHSRKDARTIRTLLRDFYESFFPLPSQFELSVGQHNAFLYKRDLNAWLEGERVRKRNINFVVFLLIACMLALLYWRKVVYAFKRISKKLLNSSSISHDSLSRRTESDSNI